MAAAYKSGTFDSGVGPEAIPQGRLKLPDRPAAIPLALFILLASQRQEARAEDSVAYKFENYTEAGGRVGVQTQGVTASQGVGSDMQFGFTAVTDAIAGATPTGLAAPAGSGEVPLAHLSDHRKAWEADLSRQFGRMNIAAGISESREHDYVSRGWSLNSLTDFNEKNTTLLAGVAGHEDDVETFFDPQRAYAKKHALNAILGVTQLLGPRTSLTLNATWGRETGYLSDQYKLVEQNVEVLPGVFFPLVFAENRPSEHNTGVVYASINRAFPELHGALEGSYRYFHDTYGISANTLELAWIEKLGNRFSIGPDLRWYEQGAARFYYYDLRSTDIIPTGVPSPGGPAYSSDYRLSSLCTTTYGAKAVWKPLGWLEFDLAYDRYTMRGRDGVTAQSAYPRANLLTMGAKISW
jgi:hypothetical protein